MARKWLSFLNSLRSHILNFRTARLWQIRWVSMVLCGILLAISFHAIALAQNPFLVQTHADEVEIVQKINQAVELSNRAREHQQRGKWEAAEEAINTSLAILENLPSTDTREAIYGQTLDISGQLDFYRGEYDRALRKWEDSERTYQNIEDLERVRQSLLHQSRALQSLGNYDRACNLLLESGGIQGRLQRFPGITNLNCAQFIQLEQALQPIPDESSINDNCDRIAGILGIEGAKCEMTRQLEQALKIPRDRLSIIAGYRLGNVLRSLGELEISLKVLQSSLDTAKSPEFDEQLAAINLSLGDTERAFGNRIRAATDAQNPPNFDFHLCRTQAPNLRYQNALKFYWDNESLDSNNPKLSYAIAQSRLNYLSLAQEIREDSHIEEMRSHLDRLLTISPTNPVQAHLTMDYIRVLSCSESPDFTKLRTQLEKIVTEAKNREDWQGMSSALGYIGALYEWEYQQASKQHKAINNSNLEKAEQYTRDALKIIKSREREARGINYQLEWQLGRISQYKQDNSAIWHYREAYRNLNELRKDLVALNREIQYDLRDKVEPIYRELAALELRSQTPPTQDQLNSAREIIESLQLIQLESFLQDNCTQAEGIKIDDLDDEAAVIYTIDLRDRLEVILSLPDPRSSQKSLYSKSLPDESLKYYSQQAEYPHQFWTQSNIINTKLSNAPISAENDLTNLSEVYEWLIRPLENYLQDHKINTLVFVLDDALRNIPIAALYDSEKEQYLIEQYAVAVTPSLQLLEPRSIDLNTLRVLAAGRSDFTDAKGWSNLNYVRDEIDAIANSIPRSETFLDAEFTSQLLREQINSLNFPIVHIATHGQFELSAKETFILAWDRQIDLEKLGQLLRVKDPSGLKDIELLIFSACRTAADNKRATLGMAGAAFEAGARSTIATLWNINDRSTAQLITKFYEELNRATRSGDKVNKAEALRLAQLELLWSEEYQHPYFWSPFILVGNWL
ncbi:MAG: CHAT domain-containing protein [Cyanobacteria bacterium P01_E01_bin.42]